MNKIKIGIVEDEMIIAETIALTLEKLGYAVVGKVGTYADALEMVKVHQPDLVLLDINLGSKKDGIDLATEIKDRFAIPIIFLTANADANTVNRAKDIHPIAYIVKPFSSTDLFSAIETSVILLIYSICNSFIRIKIFFQNRIIHHNNQIIFIIFAEITCM
jgi:CheY-like chemotaxis protein